MRTETWQHDLMTYLVDLRMQAARGQLAFDWGPRGENIIDCARFVGGGIKAVTGVDKYADFVGERFYDSAFSAMRLLKEKGYNNLEEMLAGLFEEKPVPFAHYGDIVLVKGWLPEAELEANPEVRGIIHAMAIADPPHFWALHPDHGITRGPLLEAYKAFAVE